jgi:hypothetical protein
MYQSARQSAGAKLTSTSDPPSNHRGVRRKRWAVQMDPVREQEKLRGALRSLDERQRQQGQAPAYWNVWIAARPEARLPIRSTTPQRQRRISFPWIHPSLSGRRTGSTRESRGGQSHIRVIDPVSLLKTSHEGPGERNLVITIAESPRQSRRIPDAVAIGQTALSTLGAGRRRKEYLTAYIGLGSHCHR